MDALWGSVVMSDRPSQASRDNTGTEDLQES